MWNYNAPLELLAGVPVNDDTENLQNIQQIIDVDKYINSAERGYDLCGGYAPFCDICDKNADYPCALSYVRMKQAEVPAADTTVKRRIRIAVAKRKR